MYRKQFQALRMYPKASELLHVITEKWPLQRVALLTTQEPRTSSDTRYWLSRGIEIWDEPGGPTVWLRHRLAHFDAILDVTTTEHSALHEELRRTQPQATYAELLDKDHTGGRNSCHAALAFFFSQYPVASLP